MSVKLTSSRGTHRGLPCRGLWGLLLLLALAVDVQAQVNYLMGLDKKKIHFGIQLGYTQSKFEDAYTQDDEVRGQLQGTTSYYTPGFHLAIIGDLRLGNYFNFRLLPGLTLINRTLNYSWTQAYLDAHHGADAKRSVESVYGELPPLFDCWCQLRLRFCLDAQQQEQQRPVHHTPQYERFPLHGGGGFRLLYALRQVCHRDEDDLRPGQPQGGGRRPLYPLGRFHQHTYPYDRLHL